ncbi:ATP-dependent RNA helicase RhlE [Candidatus Phycosocius bacilliformis]|uniref:DEAD-box ATP-dependent RNA helicase RhpA n=1 Tax=Candidatus Phycosocius bacilliformis TaxID=1445552 RepID=A0A2P2EB92_9PROT|nr:DEAD/DEAH box helicase [Candidatus Phycosocius bacilliformis]GBF58321.1 ATP-dependent RNA helicase RhlE [Candidatus Phycosocius bacilliformis]
MTDANGTGDTGPISETPVGVTFADLGFSPPLLEAIAETGYTKPTPIQWKAIPEVLNGRDVLGIAQTGTGKTAAFVLPMIERLAQGRARARMPRTLILEPTRELADQVAENFRKYGRNHKLTMALLIGGVSFGDQDALLTKGVDVLIATPGRLLDHFERGKLLLTGVNMLVIDEADRMLDMGFIPDIERIVKLTPFTRQTLFFSATMPPEIKRLTEQFLQGPARVEVARQSQTAATITQRLLKSPASDPKTKRTVLRVAIEAAMPTMKNGIVFCNRKTDVDIVAKSLSKHGFNAAPIHGDLQQSQRMATLERFRNNDLQILVASDVAARGLDIPDVSHVFNYDVPRHAEDYVHRIGRTGRAGRLGEAFMIVTPADSKALDAVESLIKSPIAFAELEGLPRDRVEDRRPAPAREAGKSAGRTRRGRRPDSESEDVSSEATSDSPAVENDSPSQNRSSRPSRRRSRSSPAEASHSATDPLAVINLEDGDGSHLGSDLVEHDTSETTSHGHRDRDRGDRTDRGPRRDRERGRHRHERDRPRQDRRRDEDQDVLAFGDDVPAFMKIPIHIKPIQPEDAESQ